MKLDADKPDSNDGAAGQTSAAWPPPPARANSEIGRIIVYCNTDVVRRLRIGLTIVVSVLTTICLAAISLLALYALSAAGTLGLPHGLAVLARSIDGLALWPVSIQTISLTAVIISVLSYRIRFLGRLLQEGPALVIDENGISGPVIPGCPPVARPQNGIAWESIRSVRILPIKWIGGDGIVSFTLAEEVLRKYSFWRRFFFRTRRLTSGSHLIIEMGLLDLADPGLRAEVVESLACLQRKQ